MATSMYKGQIPFRANGQTTCFHHKGGKLDLYCKTCQELACINCLSTVHDSHPLCALSEITPQNKQNILNYIDNTQNIDLVKIDRDIASTDKNLKENASNFQKLSKQLKTQTKKLKDDLDLLTAQTLSLYQQMEEDNEKLLQTYKQNLEMYSAQLKQQVQECKKSLQRGSDIQVYDVEHDIHLPFIFPVKPTLGTASFTPNRHPHCDLERALGEGISSGKRQALQDHDRPVESSARQRPFPTQQRLKGRKGVSSPVKTLLPQTEVLEEWKPPSHITSVCPTTERQTWTSNNGSKTFDLLDSTGKVIKVVKHNTRIRDISLSPTKQTLWVCDWNNNITELVSGRLKHRFSTKEVPQCICVTASNHVIVGMDKQVSKFTTDGKLVLTTMATGTGKPLVCTPYRISECPVTHNVAVADLDVGVNYGERKPHVVVMDTDFKELFVYDGKVPHTHQPALQSGGEQFHPYGVVYDTAGNLIIANRYCNRILLISGSGEFLRIIHTDGHWTHAVGVDRQDVLWAVFGICKVKILQYSSV